LCTQLYYTLPQTKLCHVYPSVRQVCILLFIMFIFYAAAIGLLWNNTFFTAHTNISWLLILPFAFFQTKPLCKDGSLCLLNAFDTQHVIYLKNILSGKDITLNISKYQLVKQCWFHSICPCKKHKNGNVLALVNYQNQFVRAM